MQEIFSPKKAFLKQAIQFTFGNALRSVVMKAKRQVKSLYKTPNE